MNGLNYEEAIRKAQESILSSKAMGTKKRDFDHVFSSLIQEVWRTLLGQAAQRHQTKDGSTPKLAAEEMVLSLKRKGIGEDMIHYKRDIFCVHLENLDYSIFKRFNCVPFSYLRSLDMEPSSIEPAAFADFMLDFDKHIPLMSTAVSEIIEVQDKIFKMKMKEEMVRRLMEITVSSLAKEHLTPLGLQATFRTSPEGVVSMDIWQRLEAHIEFPMDKIEEVLSDTEGIISKLSPTPIKEEYTSFPPESLFDCSIDWEFEKNISISTSHKSEHPR